MKFPNLSIPTEQQQKESFDNACREQERLELQRISELPKKMNDLRNEVWAQVRLLKEMGHHQNFCDRVMELFRIQIELRDKVCFTCGHAADSHVATVGVGEDNNGEQYTSCCECECKELR